MHLWDSAFLMDRLIIAESSALSELNVKQPGKSRKNCAVGLGTARVALAMEPALF